MNVELLKVYVKESFSIADVLRKMDLFPSGGNYKNLKKHIVKNNIDTSHFTGQGWNKGGTTEAKKPVSFYLTKNSKMGSYKLKKKLLDENVFEHKCYNCFNFKWLEKTIPLELHHKDGDSSNNSIENLILLCPNCHALTSSYRRRKDGSSNKVVSDEIIIEAIKSSHSRREALLKVGLSGYGGTYKRINKIIQSNPGLNFLERPIEVLYSNEDIRNHFENRKEKIIEKYHNWKELFRNKIDWPSKEELEKMLKENSCLSLGKKLGVSDSSIRKKAKSYGIDMKKISPWAHRHGSAK